MIADMTHQADLGYITYFAVLIVVLPPCFLAKALEVPGIRFEAKLFKIGSWTLLKLPKSASAKLPSRGMTMVEGTINDFHFQAALDPDGKGSRLRPKYWDKYHRGSDFLSLGFESNAFFSRREGIISTKRFTMFGSKSFPACF